MARRALCVGIDTYRLPERITGAASDVALRGSVNDALAWADVLAREYGFDSVRLLLDGEATKRSVVQGLEELFDGSRADDVLAFVFSGHGTYVVDRSGDGDERYDEAMCAHDDLLTDDEFAALFEALHSDARLTVISDSCFAAGVLDLEAEDMTPTEGEHAKGFRPKGFRPKGFRPKYLPPVLFGREPLDPAKAYPRRRIEQARMRELLLAACGPGEIALDDDFDGGAQGVLTHYALQAMREARYVLTYTEVLDRVRALIPAGAFAQVPQLEGATEGKGRIVFT